MRVDRARYFAENMDRFSRRDRVFLNNPVIMQGLGLAPIVVPANTLQTAVVLAVGAALLLTPVRMLATAVGQHLGFAPRAALYALVSGGWYFLVAMAVDSIFGPAAVSAGIYLPLLVLEPLIIKRYESPKGEHLATSFRKGIITTVGFCLALFLMASLRELLSLGTVYGVTVLRASLLPFAALPAGGFILLGMVAALWRGFVNTFRKNVSLGVKKQL